MKYILAGMIVVALLSVSSTLGVIAFFVVPIILYFITKEEEKQQDISKYGWSARHEKWEDVPPERQAEIESIKINKNINENEKIKQRVREANEGLSEKRAQTDPDSLINTLSLGFDNTRPSLKTFEKQAAELPSELGGKLMNAAKWESNASAGVKRGSTDVEFENRKEVIQHLNKVIKEVNVYKSQQKINQVQLNSDNRKVGKNALPTDDLLD